MIEKNMVGEFNSDFAINEQENDEDKYLIKSVEKAGKVLDLFTDNETLGATDVAKLLGLTKATAFRFLYSLEKTGLICRTDGYRYKLGMKLYSMGELAQGRMDLIKIAHPIMEELSLEVTESSFLSELDGMHDIIYIDKVLAPSALRIEMKLGTRYPLFTTATGKAILAFKSPEFIERYMDTADFISLTEMTLTKEMLEMELPSIRRAGYARDNQESEIGIICYAAPILNGSGEAIAGLSISGPVSRMTFKASEKIEAVKEAADKISRLAI